MLPIRNPTLAAEIKVFTSRKLQRLLASLGTIALTGFLIIHITKDLSSPAEAWYFHSTPVWMIVMLFASILFYVQWKALKKSGVDTDKIFSQLPPE
jgi:APA family basic amino acid/polyamine antiporter